MVDYSNKESNEQDQTVVCCNCFHTRQINREQEKVRMSFDYPSRFVEVNGEQWICPACSNSDNVIIFGCAFIVTDPHNINDPLVIENNAVCYKRRKKILQRAGPRS